MSNTIYQKISEALDIEFTGEMSEEIEIKKPPKKERLPDAGPSFLGFNHSDETKQKLREYMTGLKRPKYSKEHGEKVSKAKKEYWKKWHEENPDFVTKREQRKRKRQDKKETRPDNVIDNISTQNKKLIQCPHCNKEGNVGNMKRWHFDNCKSK